MTLSRAGLAGVAVTALACGHGGAPPAPGPTRASAPASAPATPAAASASPSAPLAPVTAGARASLAHGIDSLLDDPRFRSAFWGVLIVDPVHGDTLYARNADKLFLPASNMKIVTSSVALTSLGPDFRFRTAFAARGQLRDGVLHGDLVVYGRGDPTVSDHMMHDAMAPLAAAADSLAAHGIRRITGHVVSGGDAFPDANAGYGWDWDDLSQPYGAGVDELMFNEGFTAIKLRAAPRAGRPAALTTAPIDDYPVVRSHVTTVVPGGGAPAIEPTATIDPARGSLIVAGTMAPGDTTTLFVAYPDPAVAYLHAVARALRARRIALPRDAVVPPGDTIGPRVPGPSAASHTATSADARRAEHRGGARRAAPIDTLFTVLSPPLRDILPALLKPSQNQIAEVLFKTLGLERTGVGSADSGRRVVESQLAAWGAAPDGFVIHDGSGLSRHDYLSPGTLVRVLTAIRADSAFHVFFDALPIAGVDGTIAARMRGTPAAGNVHAKTGYVDRARSLSGYVTTADGAPLVFSLLCNNWTVPVRDVEQVQDAIATRLATLVLGAR